MQRNPARWRPVAIALTVLNIGGLIMALGAGEPTHAFGHVVVAVLLVRWLRSMRESREEAGSARQVQIEDLEDQVDGLRRELREAQERLDFTERMMAQRPAPKVAVERPVTPV